MAASQLAALQLTLLALFASLCVAVDDEAAHPDCAELLKPLVLDSHSPIYGKWVLSVAAWDRPGLKDDLITLKSAWIELSGSTDEGVLDVYWADRLTEGDGTKCLQGLANGTISGTTRHTTFNIQGHTSYHEGKYYETCADCLMSEDTTLLPESDKKGRYLFLFTKSGELPPSDLETFKKQAECLNMNPEMAIYGPTADLCPDDRQTTTASSDTAPEQATELTTSPEEN